MASYTNEDVCTGTKRVLELSAESAIARSIARGETVYVERSSELCQELEAEADGVTVTCSVREYRGTTPAGDDWCVRAVRGEG
jgi:hypothetical protein